MPISAVDDFLYLEDHIQSRDWVAQQNQLCIAQLDNDPRFAVAQQEILNFSQSTQQIPYFAEYAGWLYHFYQSPQAPRGAYRRTTLNSYQSESPKWLVVFDLDVLARHEEVDWFLAGISHCILQPNLCLISLNVAGSDASVCREFDLETGQFVVNGFQFPFGKNQIHWRDANSVFVCPAWDESQLTHAGYSCEAWLVLRGQVWEEAFNLAVLPETAFKALAWRFLDGDSAVLDIVEAALSFYKKVYYCITPDLSLQQITLPLQCDVFAYSHGDLIVKIAINWTWQGVQYPSGALLAIECDSSNGQLGRVQVLLSPTKQQTIQGLDASFNGLAVNLLDCVKSHIQTFIWQAGQWRKLANPLPTNGAIEFIDQPWRSDVLYYNYSDFLQPAGLYRYELQSGKAPQLLRQQVAAFDSHNFTYQQFFASAKDGTPIPYFVVHRQGLVLDGQTPSLLYGYGGFQLSLLPYYVDNLGPQWLAKGGAFVVANIRGGGEFGPAWHQAAQARQRQVSFDDFIAIAEDLIERNITSPRRLGVQGGSHGGLLVGACLTQRPELFNAVVCEVPLLDMLRYTELHAGASWMDEYGDPSIPEDYAAIAAYSPYHHIKPASAQRHPKVLFTTHSQDDRVHPAHARKMAAKMQTLGHQVLFYENEKGGHRGGVGAQEMASDLARALTFLYQELMD